MSDNPMRQLLADEYGRYIVKAQDAYALCEYISQLKAQHWQLPVNTQKARDRDLLDCALEEAQRRLQEAYAELGKAVATGGEWIMEPELYRQIIQKRIDNEKHKRESTNGNGTG